MAGQQKASKKDELPIPLHLDRRIKGIERYTSNGVRIFSLPPHTIKCEVCGLEVEFANSPKWQWADSREEYNNPLPIFEQCEKVKKCEPASPKPNQRK